MEGSDGAVGGLVRREGPWRGGEDVPGMSGREADLRYKYRTRNLLAFVGPRLSCSPSQSPLPHLFYVVSQYLFSFICHDSVSNFFLGIDISFVFLHFSGFKYLCTIHFSFS